MGRGNVSEDAFRGTAADDWNPGQDEFGFRVSAERGERLVNETNSAKSGERRRAREKEENESQLQSAIHRGRLIHGATPKGARYCGVVSGAKPWRMMFSVTTRGTMNWSR